MLETFLKHFPPTKVSKPSDTLIQKYQETAPSFLINIWTEHGIGKYGNGIIELINPEEYEPLLWTWLGKLAPNYIPIGITAFGDLFYYRKLTDTEEDVCVINIQTKQIETLVWSAADFFTTFLTETETKDSLLDEPIFVQACAKFGALQNGDIYTYAPFLASGGSKSIDNLNIGSCLVYHDILLQFYGIAPWVENQAYLEPSQEDIQALEILSEWAAGRHFYNPYLLHDLEMMDTLDPWEDMDAWFHTVVKGRVPDKFLQFAADGTGGAYALWFYPGLRGPAPVVFFGSEGETNVLAPSLRDFVCLIASGKILYANWTEEGRTPEDLWSLNITDDYLEDIMSEQKCSKASAKKLVAEDIISYQKRVSKYFSCRPFDTIMKDSLYVRDFVKWTEEVTKEYQNNELPEPITDPNYLDLADRDITILSESLIKNPFIKVLDLDNNFLTEIPDFLRKLKTLQKLRLSNNELETIPKYIEEFTGLVELSINENNIKKLDLDFSKLRCLTTLDIADNPITLDGLDPSIFKCKSLFTLYFSHTGISRECSELEFILKFDSKDILNDVEHYSESERDDWSDEDKVFMEEIYKKRVALYPSSATYYDLAYFYMYKLNERYEEATEHFMECFKRKDDGDFEAKMYTDYGRLLYVFLEKDYDTAERFFKAGAEMEGEDAEYCLKHYARFLVYQKDDYPKADEIYKKLLAEDPKDLDYLNEYAEFHAVFSLDHKQAIRLYKQLLEKDSTKKKKWLKKIANIYSMHLEDYEHANEYYKKLLKIKKKKSYYKYYLSSLSLYALENEADLTYIETIFAEARTKYPNNIHIREMYYEFRVDHFPEQVGIDLKENANDAQLVLKYIVHLFAKRDFIEAKNLLKVAIPLNPTVLALSLNLFLSQEYSGEDINSIKKDFKIFYTQHSEEFETSIVFLNFMDRNTSDKKELVTLAQKTLTLCSAEQEQQANYCKGVIRKANFDEDKVLSYTKEVALLGTDINELTQLVKQEFQFGSMEKSMAILRYMDQLEPTNFTVLVLYTSVIGELSNAESSIKFLLKKLESHPNHINVLKAIGNVHVRLLKYKEAIYWFEKAQKVSPKDEEVTTMLEQLKDKS